MREELLQKILDFDGNKYELCAAVIKYVKDLEANKLGLAEELLNKGPEEKIAVKILEKFLNGEIKYRKENVENAR